MHFRRRPVLPTVSGCGTRETSKVRPSLPLGAASSRRATPQPSRPVFFPHLLVGRGDNSPHLLRSPHALEWAAPDRAALTRRLLMAPVGLSS